MKKQPLVSIIMLTHNAPEYVKTSITTLEKTTDIPYELITVDNKSEQKTRKVLLKSFAKGKINKLLFLDENTLFAKGNNAGEKICHKDSKYILLLNSDVEIIDQYWLKKMLNVHKRGITSLGFVAGNPYDRADGYCFLIDKDLYEKHHGLDENFEWFWSITLIQAKILKENLSVIAVKDHEKLLHHFGGASGGDWQGAKGMDVDTKNVIKWFSNKQIKTLDTL